MIKIHQKTIRQRHIKIYLCILFDIKNEYN